MWVDGGSKISRLVCLAADVKITNCRERRSRGCPEVQAVRMNYVNSQFLYLHLYLLYEINIGQGADPFSSSMMMGDSHCIGNSLYEQCYGLPVPPSLLLSSEVGTHFASWLVTE